MVSIATAATFVGAAACAYPKADALWQACCPRGSFPEGSCGADGCNKKGKRGYFHGDKNHHQEKGRWSSKATAAPDPSSRMLNISTFQQWAPAFTPKIDNCKRQLWLFSTPC